MKFNETGEPDEFLKSVNHVDETKFGIAVCTVDGQRFSIGDAKTQFSLQALARPITYGCVLSTPFGLHFHLPVLLGAVHKLCCLKKGNSFDKMR